MLSRMTDIPNLTLNDGHTVPQLGYVFPKTMSAQRMRENLDVLDFELGPEEMTELATLAKGEAGRIGPHPETVN